MSIKSGIASTALINALVHIELDVNELVPAIKPYVKFYKNAKSCAKEWVDLDAETIPACLLAYTLTAFALACIAFICIKSGSMCLDIIHASRVICPSTLIIQMQYSIYMKIFILFKLN